MDGENSNVVSDVAALANAAERAEQSEEMIETVIEIANERVARAEQTAEQIAQAAMESERGREIENLRKDIFSWRSELDEFKATFRSLSSEMEVLKGQIAGLATLQVRSEISPVLSSSIQSQTEPISETMEPLQAIVPEAISNAVVAESPALQTQASQKRKRWI